MTNNTYTENTGKIVAKAVLSFPFFVSKTLKLTQALFFFTLLTISSAYAQQPVTSVITTTQPATPKSIGAENWGTGNDIYLENLIIGPRNYRFTDLASDYSFVRVDNATISGTRCRIFVERTNNLTYTSTYPEDSNGDCSMEIALKEPIINRGALDVFHNVTSGTQHANNIERLDVIFGTSMNVPTDPAQLVEGGFFANEKSGNNEFKVAAILSLDAQGKPASFGPLVYIDGTTADYGRLNPSYDWRFCQNAPIAPHGDIVGYANTTEQIGYTLITFQDLGVIAGLPFYGLSFFGKDVTASHDLLDPTTFPQDTDEGADIHGGLGGLFITDQINIEELLNNVVAENDINQTPVDTPVTGKLLTNDSDKEGDVITVQSATGLDASGAVINIPTDGTATTIYDANGTEAGSIQLNANGTYTFTPAAGFTGAVPVEYVAVDDNGIPATDTATLTIEVIGTISSSNPANPPVANDDTNTTEQNVTVITNILSNDKDPSGDVLTVTSATGWDATGAIINLTITPTNVFDVNGELAGQASLNASGQIIFTAAADFKGEVPMDYVISDGNGGTDDATLTITVETENATDNDVFANDDANIGPIRIAQTGNVITNDNDPEGNTMNVSLVVDNNDAVIPTDGSTHTLPSGGTITFLANGDYNYTPAPNFVGTEEIRYRLCDNGTPQACDAATLYLTTLPINTTDATDDINHTPYEVEVSGNVLTNDVDKEGNNQTVTLVAGMPAAEGTVTLNADGTYDFMPANGFVGVTSFEYQVCDDAAVQACEMATTYIEVIPVVSSAGQPPIALPDANKVKAGITATGTVFSNDIDPDGMGIDVTSMMIDNTGNGVADVPATVGTGVTVAGMDSKGNLVANAGQLTLNANGTYTFIPNAGFVGKVTAEYTITDGDGQTDMTELMIEVVPATDNTTFAADDAQILDAGVTATGNLLDNDRDAEGDVQTISSFKIDTNGDGLLNGSGATGVPTSVYGLDASSNIVVAGNLTIQDNGAYTFEPAAGFVGNVEAPYALCDNNVSPTCTNATLTITVQDVKADYGDGPALYPDAWHRALTDLDGNNVLDGVTDVWLGAKTSFDVASMPSPTGDMDAFDDAMAIGTGAGEFPTSMQPSTNYNVDVTVNSATPSTVYYGMWIDYDEDGVYDQFYTGALDTGVSTTASVSITTPSDLAAIGTANVNVRLRVYDAPLTASDFQGGLTNGEVEDYRSVVALPVDILFFEGESNNCVNTLNWATASEENNSYFIIEYSSDGDIFKVIGRVEGHGNSVNVINYDFVHDNAQGTEHYYRLKQMDFDDNFEYSDIIYLKSDCSGITLSSMKVYPNPTAGYVYAQIGNESEVEEEIEIIVTNLLGQVIMIQKATMVQGLNNVKVDLSELIVGMYNITIKKSSGSALHTTSIVKNIE